MLSNRACGHYNCAPGMGRIIDLVKAYQQAQDEPQKQRLGLEVAEAVVSHLDLYIRKGQKPDFAGAVMEKTLYQISSHLHLFQIRSDDDRQFLRWCRTIARNEIRQHGRKEGRQRTDAVDPLVLQETVEAAPESMSAGDRVDYEYAISLLRAVKPPCYHYLWFRFAAQMSYAEIAEEFGLPTDNAARKQVERCRKLAESLIRDPPSNV